MTDIFSLEGVFTLSSLFTFIMLLALQAVLGFNNLLCITIESRRVEPTEQRMVRRVGIGVAVAFRLVLLIGVLLLFSVFTRPLFSIDLGPMLNGEFTLRAVTLLMGGILIIYTAIKEIFHLLSVDHLEHAEAAGRRSVRAALTLIVATNLAFSFTSLLSAVALTNKFMVIAPAMVAGCVLMIWLSDHVARFLEQNRAYQVLGLFGLFAIGVLLVTDAGQLADMALFGYEVEAMSKASFYLVILIIAAIAAVQTQYRNKLMAQRAEAARAGVPTSEPDVGFLQAPDRPGT